VDNILVAVPTKGPHLDTLEKFYVLRETRKCSQINNKCTIGPNRTFDVITEYKTAPKLLISFDLHSVHPSQHKGKETYHANCNSEDYI